MSIRPALDALLEALQDAGSPLAASLAPGLSRTRIDAIASPLPGRLASEVIEYFEWRNGLAPDRGADLELFPQGIPINLDEAVALYRMQRAAAEQVAKQAGVPASDLWHEGWFPLFHDGAGGCHVTQLAAGPAATAPVRAVNSDDRQTTRTYGSLTALIEHVTARWTARAYAISEAGGVEEAPPLKAPDAVDALIAGLRHFEEHERWNAARALGELRDARAVPGLIRALDDPADVVAKTAAAGLGLMKARDAIPGLIRALQGSGPQTRNVSAWALGEMKADAARDALTRALDDPLGMVRQSAAAALERLDQKRR